MVAVSLQIEGPQGLTWPLWRRWVAEVEPLGFAGLFRSDHLPGRRAALETMISLAYAADHTTRIHFGTLVSPLSFRDPVILAWQVAALDDLSQGRFILGLGTGYHAPEHEQWGFDLHNFPTRAARFEEGLDMMIRLLRHDEPVTFSGRFFRLQDAHLLPRPHRPQGPPIMIGGKGTRRMLPLVARHADIWNASRLNPEEFRERSATLDRLLREVGRQPGDVRRTAMISVFCGRDEAELERRLRYVRQIIPGAASQPLAELTAQLYADFRSMIGTPEYVAEQIEAYAAAGVDELMLQWMDVADFEGIQIIADEVLPRLGHAPAHA